MNLIWDSLSRDTCKMQDTQIPQNYNLCLNTLLTKHNFYLSDNTVTSYQRACIEPYAMNSEINWEEATKDTTV